MSELFNKGNYRDTFREEADNLNKCKDVVTQSQRHINVETLIETYVQQTGERPPSDGLSTLTAYYLKDWYRNNDRYKMKEENSFLTNRQIDFRESHERSSLLIENYGHTGRFYNVPTREFMRNWRRALGDDNMSVRLSKVKAYNDKEGSDES